MAEGRHIHELMIIYKGGVNGAITLNGSPVEAKAGAERLHGRKNLGFFNLSGSMVWWAWSEETCNADDGFPVPDQTGLSFVIADNVPIFLFGTGDVRVQESQ